MKTLALAAAVALGLSVTPVLADDLPQIDPTAISKLFGTFQTDQTHFGGALGNHTETMAEEWIGTQQDFTQGVRDGSDGSAAFFEGFQGVRQTGQSGAFAHSDGPDESTALVGTGGSSTTIMNLVGGLQLGQ